MAKREQYNDFNTGTGSSEIEWDGLDTEMKPLPPGVYTVEVAKLFEHTSKSKGTKMLMLVLRVMDEGDFLGRQITVTFGKEHEVARQIFARFLKAVDAEVVPGGRFDSKTIESRRLQVATKQRVNESTGEVMVDVDRYMKLVSV